jgi:phosphate regulon sensor kinase PhoR
MIGWITGHITLFLLMGVLIYLGWHLTNLIRLGHWLRDGKRFQPPQAGGFWGEVFNGIYRLRKRNRKHRKKLTRLLARFQESAEALPDAAVLLGRCGRLKWWNQAGERLLGLHWPKDVGHPVTNLVQHPAFAQYLASGDYTETVEFPSPVSSDTLLEVRIVPYSKNQRLMLARDVTRIHRLEQMRRNFVANVSHELRTPLTVLHGVLETLLDEAEQFRESPTYRSLELMAEQTSRMARIVNDLLLLARLETQAFTLQHSPVRVPEILEALRQEALTLSSSANHKVGLEIDHRLHLMGSGDELRSVFSNLVFNAIKYTPAKGEIQMRWYESTSGAHFEVRDTGVGIASHHIPRLTERFYRVDVSRSRQSGGTGLGLAIVKHVLTRHNACLHIDSTLGKGSVFRCDFPRTLIVREQEQALQAASLAGSRRDWNIGLA